LWQSNWCSGTNGCTNGCYYTNGCRNRLLWLLLTGGGVVVIVVDAVKANMARPWLLWCSSGRKLFVNSPFTAATRIVRAPFVSQSRGQIILIRNVLAMM
jgi:hypothetical protein